MPCSERHRSERCSCLCTVPFPQRSPAQPFTLLYPHGLQHSFPHGHFPAPHRPPMHICVRHNRVPMPTPPPPRRYLNSSGSDGSTGFPPHPAWTPPAAQLSPPPPALGWGRGELRGLGVFQPLFAGEEGASPPPPLSPPPEAGSALWLHGIQQNCTLMVHPRAPPWVGRF